MTTLTQRFLNQSPELSPEAFPLPLPSDIAFFIHTSSASSISNLKCVSLTHETILSGNKSIVAWWKKAWPDKDFEHLRVIGWSSWSHILGIYHDLGGATLATAGCYCFGVIPSTYTSPEFPDEHKGELNIVSRLFDAVIRIKPDVFWVVPWVLEGFKDEWSREKVADRKEIMQRSLERMKTFACGGAALSEELALWAKDMNIPLTVDIGMTELGREYSLFFLENFAYFCLFSTLIIIGGLFSSKADDFGRHGGWSMNDCLISDAELRLIDEDGNETAEGILVVLLLIIFLVLTDTVITEGELVITSGMISQGYLKFDNSVFTKAPDGRTTFRTGDIYAKTTDDYFIWKGRKDDYIQVGSCQSSLSSLL
jgi:acyl-CoA synthetase (AMP-forming)/AMP-acid ligase II